MDRILGVRRLDRLPLCLGIIWFTFTCCTLSLNFWAPQASISPLLQVMNGPQKSGIITTKRQHTVVTGAAATTPGSNSSTTVLIVNDALEWQSGCQRWRGVMTESQIHHSLRQPPPTGLLVTLLHGRKKHQAMACHTLPTQLIHFVEPHGSMDVLLVVSGGGKQLTINYIIGCLQLSPSGGEKHERTWNNLDGTTLITFQFLSQSNKTTIYLGVTDMHYPKYIQLNPQILNEPIVNARCQVGDDPNYIQGTRWYANEFLHLSILSNYDYWIKLDTDVIFTQTIAFHMLQDMRHRRAIFGHTGEYQEEAVRQCSNGIVKAVYDFFPGRTNGSTEWLEATKYKSFCSPDVKIVQRDSDQYYANFVIGQVEFWQSAPVLEFATFLSEYHPGYFRYRWTDQIFYHYAMGMFVGPDFTSAVASYVELRCAPNYNCWMSSHWFPNPPPGMASVDLCWNGGSFLHTKNVVGMAWTSPLFATAVAERRHVLFQSHYKYNRIACFQKAKNATTIMTKPPPLFMVKKINRASVKVANISL